MKRINRLLFVALLCIQCIPAFSRSKVGSWKEHYTYLAANKMCEWNGEWVVATPEGLMCYSLSDGTIRLISSLTGLTEKGIVDIGFDAQTQSLIVAYSNGALDILCNDKIFSIKDIKTFGVGSNVLKGIFIGTKIYAYGSFGIAVVDVFRREIRDNFWPLDPIDSKGILSLQEYEGRLYATIPNALYSIDAQSALMSDPSAWKLEFGGSGISCMLATVSGLFVAVDKTDGTSLLRKYQSGQWSDYYTSDIKYLTLSETPDAVWAMGDSKMQRVHKVSAFLMNEWTSYGKNWPGFAPRMLLEKNRKRWIADSQLGLIVWDNDFERVRPIRPDVLNRLGVDAGAGSLWILGSGQLAKIGQNVWQNTYDRSINNAVCIKKNPIEDDGFVLGTNNGKLIKWTGLSWDSLRIGAGNISSLQYDKWNNLWGIRSAADGPIFVERDGQVVRLDISSLANKNAAEMHVDTYGIVWALFPNVGVLAIQATGTSIGNKLPEVDNLRYRLVSAAEMGISGFKIRSIASDQDGVLWLGTTGGVFAVYNAANVFTGTMNANRVLVKTSIEGQGAYLLETEVVADVLIDGANRKWFATEASGLYLQSANGANSILHFTPENSPLPSQNVQKLCIEPQSGEVFVFTDAGALSYMPDASDAAQTFAQAKVYPNPVRPEYSGIITVSGLKENTKIRVTDIAGDLCAEGVSNGGIWVWDGKTFHGKRPSTGVYLFFLSDEAGQETKILKLLFVH